nr:E3 ubiquitin-protein ligase RFWD3-like isoform X2 [Procambarus clarkii]
MSNEESYHLSDTEAMDDVAYDSDVTDMSADDDDADGNDVGRSRRNEAMVQEDHEPDEPNMSFEHQPQHPSEQWIERAEDPSDAGPAHSRHLPDALPVSRLPHPAPEQQSSGLLEASNRESSSTSAAVVEQPLAPSIVSEPNIQAGPSCNITPQKANPVCASVPGSPESEDEGQICSICFEPWGNSGDHRLSSLKCGHLFGHACIIRWLKGQKGKCPQCNAKATKKEIRVLYAKSLKVLDTSERDKILKDLEREKEAKRKLELEHAQTKLKYELKAQLVVKLQEELKILRNATAGTSGSHGVNFSQNVGSSSQRKAKLIMHSGVDIAKDGGCRVMAYNEWLNMLVVSMPSQVTMFPGYGVRKVNMLDLKPERYVHIHQKQIRDLAFNPAKNDLLLSVAMDKMVKLTNICSNAPVASFMAEAPLWSCCWNADEANKFFVGTATGSVVEYDTRNTTGPIQTIKVAGSGPVVSMCYVPYNADANFRTGGLLVARLQSCSFVEVNEGGVKDHALPLEGPFTCVSLEKSTRHILVSCRPSQKYPHARHIICELQSVDISSDLAELNQVVTANTIHIFQGGTTQKVLSRSCAFVNPVQEGNLVACASDESTRSTCLWDLSSTSCLQQLRGPDTVIDILPVRSNQNEYLTLLTDKSVKFYRWIDIL